MKKKLTLSPKLYEIAMRQPDVKPDEIQTPENLEQATEYNHIWHQMRREKRARRPKPRR